LEKKKGSSVRGGIEIIKAGDRNRILNGGGRKERPQHHFGVLSRRDANKLGLYSGD